MDGEALWPLSHTPFSLISFLSFRIVFSSTLPGHQDNMTLPLTSNSTAAQYELGLGSFNFGNGLIEISALTSLIGSTAADSLALGDKGPAGLVWATMTVFGVMSVVKLFIATATPGWLRESVGVRSPKADATIGLSLDLNKSYKSRGLEARAIAVECETKVVSKHACS